jgi:hypothetical protein
MRQEGRIPLVCPRRNGRWTETDVRRRDSPAWDGGYYAKNGQLTKRVEALELELNEVGR